MIFDRLSEKPKIRGKVLFFMVGETQDKQHTGIILFLYLTNSRKNAVHLIDYDIELGLGKRRFLKRFQKLAKPQYGISEVNFTFFDRQGKQIDIQDFNKKLIHRQEKPVEFGVPLSGYVMVVDDIKWYTTKAHWIRVTSTDVFGHKHKFVTSLHKLPDLVYIGGMFGGKITIPERKLTSEGTSV